MPNNVFTSSIALCALLAAAPGGGWAAGEAQVAVVLLPAEVSPPGEIRITHDGSARRTSCVSFDLSPVPEGARPVDCTLRVVGKPAGDATRIENPNAQIVRMIQQAETDCAPKPEAKPLGGWTMAPPGRPAAARDDRGRPGGLCDAVQEALTKKQKLRLHLSSVTPETDWAYGGTEASEASAKPRLILSYAVAGGPPSPPRGETTAWKFHTPRPTLAKVKIGSFNTVVSGPFVAGDQVVVIAKPTPTETRLYSLSTAGGSHRWSWPLPVDAAKPTRPGTPTVHSVVDGNGRLYNFSDKGISVYDLAPSSEQAPNRHLGSVLYSDVLVGKPTKVTLQAAPTVAPGGNVYVVGSAPGHVYALTPFSTSALALSFREIWRSKEVGTRATRVAVSPPGPDFVAYALAENGTFILDAATGEPLSASDWDPRPEASRSKLRFFHDPAVASGAAGDYVILAAFNDSEAVLGALTRQPPPWTPRWSKTGPVAQPGVDQRSTPEETAVVAVRSGFFERLRLDTGAPTCRTTAFGAASNLALDGAGAAYFWYQNHLHAYAAAAGPDPDASCEGILTWRDDDPIVQQRLPALLTLLFAGDGSLLVRTRAEPGKDPHPSGDLYALHRTSTADLTISISELEDATIYSAPTVRLTGPRAAGKRQVWVKASHQITFARGFRWPRGSVLRTAILDHPVRKP